MSTAEARGRTVIVTLAGIVAGALWIALAEGGSAGWLIWPTLAGAVIAGAAAIIFALAVSGAGSRWFHALMDGIMGMSLGMNVVGATLAVMGGDVRRAILGGLFAGALLVVVLSVLLWKDKEEA